VRSLCGNGWHIYITMLMFVNMKYRYCFAKCTAVEDLVSDLSLE